MTDEEFDGNLRRTFGELAVGRGACPGVETLSAYSRGALAPADRAGTEEHLKRCGVCHALVYRVRQFDEIAARDRGPDRKWAFVRGPVPGYVLAAALAALFLLQPWPNPQSLKPTPAIVLSLDRTRAATPALADANLSKSTLVLSFFVPVEPEKRYVAVIRKRGNSHALVESVVSGVGGNGNMHLVLPPGLLAPGDYQLVVEESGGREYAFDFGI